MKKPVDVYLAGGMKSGWQDRIRADLRKLQEKGLVRWSDPRDSLTKNQGEIKLLNAVRIKTADIIFTNEQDRDSQIAAINLELKFARQLGKNIIVLAARETGYLASENPEFWTTKWTSAVNILEEMILAMAGGE